MVSQSFKRFFRFLYDSNLSFALLCTEIDQEQAREDAKELMAKLLMLNEEVADRKVSLKRNL